MNEERNNTNLDENNNINIGKDKDLNEINYNNLIDNFTS